MSTNLPKALLTYDESGKLVNSISGGGYNKIAAPLQLNITPDGNFLVILNNSSVNETQPSEYINIFKSADSTLYSYLIPFFEPSTIDTHKERFVSMSLANNEIYIITNLYESQANPESQGLYFEIFDLEGFKLSSKKIDETIYTTGYVHPKNYNGGQYDYTYTVSGIHALDQNGSVILTSRYDYKMGSSPKSLIRLYNIKTSKTLSDWFDPCASLYLTNSPAMLSKNWDEISVDKDAKEFSIGCNITNGGTGAIITFATPNYENYATTLTIKRTDKFYGLDNLQLYDFAKDSLGRIYAVLPDGSKIVKMIPADNETGGDIKYYEYFGSRGSKKGQFKGLSGLQIDKSDRLFTLESDNHRYQYFIKDADSDKDDDSNYTDCNDNDPSINKFALEICGDLVDNNCDGKKDQEDPLFAKLGQTCGGYEQCPDEGVILCSEDGLSLKCSSVTIPKVEICSNNIDEDCNGSDLSCNDVDDDGDSFTENKGDCDDGNSLINPKVAEICDNGIDENCSGSDLSCNDVDDDGDLFTENKGDCDDGDSKNLPGATEICDNDIDEDCDGLDAICPSTGTDDKIDDDKTGDDKTNSSTSNEDILDNQTQVEEETSDQKPIGQNTPDQQPVEKAAGGCSLIIR
jgi:hypothetical protein